MRKVRTKGNCLQCGKETNIILDNSKYACADCLNELGKQQKYMYDTIVDILDKGVFE